jgi:hypothetical protein
LSYTLAYGKTYEEWARQKAERVASALAYFYEHNEAIDVKSLALTLYRERLGDRYALKWRPIDPNDPRKFCDYKPSAPIVNFSTHLLDKLEEDGYLKREDWFQYEYSEEDENPEPILIRYGSKYYVLRIPSIEYLTELCTWSDPIA